MQKDLYFIASSRYLKTLITHYDQLLAHYRELSREYPEASEKYYLLIREIVQARTMILNRIKKQLDQIKIEAAKERDEDF